MPYPLETKFAAAWPPADWADVTVLAAVSGGCDSVALLRLLTALKTGGAGRICVAHLNHQLRSEADRDEQFVVELCRQLDVPCEVGHAAVDRLAAASGDGIEAAARAARYQFLAEAAGRLGARFVVTAHTADDQAETILHRIIRGTGIRGLSGMARSRALEHAVLIRPLLGLRRHELKAYLAAIHQPYCCDASNNDVRFTRNRLRREVMPMLREQFNPMVTEALLRLGTLAGEAQTVVDGLIETTFDHLATIEDSGAVQLDLNELTGKPRYLVRELLMALWRRQGWPMQSMGHGKWDELCAWALSPAPPWQRIFPGHIRVEVFPREAQMRLHGPEPRAAVGQDP